MSVWGDEAVVGGSDHALHCLSIKKGKKTRLLHTKTYGHSEWVTCVTHLADGRVLSGGMDGKLCLWEKAGARCTDMLGHHGSVACVKSNSEGTTAFSGGYDKTVRRTNPEPTRNRNSEVNPERILGTRLGRLRS